MPCQAITKPSGTTGLVVLASPAHAWLQRSGAETSNMQCRYFPCTVEWFLERCSLALVKRGLRRQVPRLGKLDECQSAANALWSAAATVLHQWLFPELMLSSCSGAATTQALLSHLLHGNELFCPAAELVWQPPMACAARSWRPCWTKGR